MKTAPKKITKYRAKIANMLTKTRVSRKDIESVHGCLQYVAGVEPFGIPFLTPLIQLIAKSNKPDSSLANIPVSTLVKRLLRVWDRILVINKGISLDYILDRLPRAKFDIFADASTSWGIGGCCGD